MRPNARASSVSESATLAITATAARLRKEGKDVVGLGAGEPDFPTPEPVCDAAIEGIRAGKTRYTPASGTPELRAAGAKWFQREFGLAYEPNQVMVTAGAKAALHMALMALVEPGDRVLIPAPYWVSYPDLVQVADGVAQVVPAVPDNGFVHTGDDLRRAAAAGEGRAAGVILNFPGNPSGAVPSEAQVKDLMAAAVELDMWVLTDEIYATLLYEGAVHHSPALFAPERCMVINGGSKSHSLTGWRVGFLAGPADVIAACGRMQSQVIGNPAAPSQEAGLAACELDLSAEQAKRREAFNARRTMLVAAFQEIPGMALTPPMGAFYAFVDARELCATRGIDDEQLCKQLLEEALVAVVPGTAFGAPGFLRISYAASMETLEKGVARIREFAGRGR